MSIIQQLKLVLPVLVLSNACAGLAEQTNQTLYASLEFVSARLARALSYYPDDLCNREESTGSLEEEPNSWTGFLGRGEGMSMLERRNAFDAYLSALGTADLLACKTNSVEVSDRGGFKADEVELAISLCRVLNHTNAWTSLKALALNPQGIAKDDALELAVRFGPVDGEMTAFVESVITNKTGWSKICRGSSAYEVNCSNRMEPPLWQLMESGSVPLCAGSFDPSVCIPDLDRTLVRITGPLASSLTITPKRVYDVLVLTIR